jgi:speckle-type POZ protein
MQITSTLRCGALNAGILESAVENYSKLSMVQSKPPQILTTPSVELGICKWAIKVFPAGNEASNQGHLSCFLHNISGRKVAVLATLSLIDGAGVEHEAETIQHSTLEYGCDGDDVGFKCFIAHEKLSRQNAVLLVGDVLRIRVEIHSAVFVTPYAAKCVQDSHHVYFGLSCSPFIQSGSDSRDAVFPADVQISTTAGEIGAHKYVLALRSPVFCAMFKTGMKEVATDTIEITDFTGPVVQAFVSFLYEDRCAKSVLQEQAVHLWRMADKYQVPGLIAVCEQYLVSTLSASNVIERLVLSEEYSGRLTELRAEALAFLSINAAAVLEHGILTELPVPVVRDIIQLLATK